VTVAEIADHVRGRLLNAEPGRVVTGLASLESAGANEIAIVFDELPESGGHAGVLVVGPKVRNPPERPVIVVAEPRVALAQLSALFAAPIASGAGVHPSAIVSPDARIDPSAFVGPLCVVESGAVIGPATRLVAQVYVGRGVVLGAQCLILPSVTLYPGTRIGARVTVQAGAQIGCDGYGYVTESPELPKVHSLGGVVLEDDTEIGANSTIQRGTFTIHASVAASKIGDASAFGHNVTVGQSCLVAGRCGVAGSVVVGDRVQIAVACSCGTT